MASPPSASPMFHEITTFARIQKTKHATLSDHAVELGESPGKGKGVFAKRALKKDEFVTVYPSHAVGTQIDSERVAWQCPRPYTPEYVNKMSKHYAVAVMGGVVAGDPELHDEGLGHMVNDGARSRSPADADVYRMVSRTKENVHPYVMCTMVEDVRGSTVLMRATRDIEKGEELLYSYGVPYWEEDHP